MRIKKLIVLFYLTFISCCGMYGQSVEFYKLYSGWAEVSLRSIDTTFHNGYIAAGKINNVNGADYFIIKLDSLGNEEWRKINVMFTSYDSSNAIFCIRQLSDFTFIGCGKVDIAPPVLATEQNYLIKFDSLGNKLWEKIWGFGLFQSLQKILINDESSFITVGTKDLGISLQKFDVNGDSIWCYDYAFTPYIVRGVSNLVKNYNSDLLILLRLTDSTLVNSISGIVKLDSSGNFISSHFLADTSLIFTAPLSIQQSGNGNYIIVSKTNSSLHGAYTNVTVLDSNYSFLNRYDFYHTYAGAAVFIDSVSFCVAGDGINTFKGNSSGSIWWNLFTSEPEAQPAEVIVDQKGCFVCCGSIDDGSRAPSIGFALRICDTIISTSYLDLSTRSHEIKVSPNPFTDFTEVAIAKDLLVSNEPLYFLLYDISGRIWKKNRIRASNFIIEKSGLPAGVYTIMIVSTNKLIHSHKIIIN